MKSKRGHGEGSIRRRGRKFEASVMIDGWRHVERFETKSDARKWIATKKSNAVRGLLKVEKKPERIRFDDLCRLYKISKTRELARKRRRPGSVRFFDYHVKILIDQIGRVFLDELEPEHIESVKKLRHEAGACPATINHDLAVVRQVLNFALRKQYIKWSPMVAVEKVDTEEHDRKRRESVRILRAHEIRAFFDALPNLEQRAFFTVMFFCGLRRAEMFRMRTEWLDFENAIMWVRIAKRGSSDIPMSPRVVEVLKALAPKAGAFVFPPPPKSKGAEAEKAGTRVERVAMRRALPAALRAAGIDPTGVGFHTFRRSFLTLVERLPGVSYSIVRDLARHGVTSVTDRYLRPPTEDVRRALAALEEVVFGTAIVLVLPHQAAG